MTTATETTSDPITAIRQSAEAMHAAELEVIGTASLGDVVRQGDVYLVCLDGLPDMKPCGRQLAPGTTQGSRHVLVGDCTIGQAIQRQVVADTVNRLVRGSEVPAELIGPVFTCLGPVDVTHPQHGDKRLPEGSTWATVYQRAYADEIRRVMD